MYTKMCHPHYDVLMCCDHARRPPSRLTADGAVTLALTIAIIIALAAGPAHHHALAAALVAVLTVSLLPRCRYRCCCRRCHPQYAGARAHGRKRRERVTRGVTSVEMYSPHTPHLSR